MSSPILNENNPFFNYEIDKLCIICNYELIPSETYSIFNELSKTEPQINVFNALERVSNFKQRHISNGPQNICHTCYHNTIAALRFWKMCEQSISFLESYQQQHAEIEIKPELISTEPFIEFPMAMSPDELNVKTEIDSDTCAEQDDTTMIHEEVTIKTELNSDRDDNKKQENLEEHTNKVECEVCHKYYKADYLTKHRRVHTGERPYGCNTCDKRFKNPTDLKTHIQCVHSDARDFLCNTCGKSFKILAKLKLHERVHTDERPHKCEFCGKKFRERIYLKNHYSVHSDEKPFACEVCTKSFSNRKHLVQHMLTHEQVKRHECHLCGNRFTQAHSLRTHLAKHCTKLNTR